MFVTDAIVESIPADHLRELVHQPRARLRRAGELLFEGVERLCDGTRDADAQAPGAAFGDLVRLSDDQYGPRPRIGGDIKAVLRAVVDVVVQSKGGGGGAARTADHQHAWHVEALLVQPALCLALHRLADSRRSLRDETHLARMPDHHLVDAADSAGVERLQRGPEIGRAVDLVPDQIAAAPLLPRRAP